MSITRAERMKAVLLAALAAFTVAGVGGALTDIGPWYAALAKPAWQPPDWLFGPVWTLIFCLIALSGVFAWFGSHDTRSRGRVLALYAVNAILNVCWSLLFFHLQRPDWALAQVGVLWLSIVVLALAVARHSRLAALLLVPYLVWVSFAAVLNREIVLLNAPFAGQ